MNFKDAYKSYNDEIKGDPKVLDAILNGKKQNKKVLFIRPSYVGAIAAMVVIAVSVFGFGNFNKGSDSPQTTYIASNNTDSTNIVPNTQFVAGNSGEDDLSGNTSGGATVSSDQNNDFYGTNPNEELNTSSSDPELGNETMTVSEENPEPAMPQGRALPGEQIPDDTMVTTADCYAYFGFDVTEKAKLPGDMTFGGNVIINAEKSAETGKLENCSFSIDAYSETDPQRILNVNITKSNLPQNSSDIEFFVSDQSGAVTGGAFTEGCLSVRVDSVGLTQDEVLDILNSFK